MEQHTDNRNTSQSLSRGLRVLEALAGDSFEIGIRELSRVLGLNTTIVHRLVRTLVERGFVEQNPETLRYGVGIRTFQVGNRYLAARNLGEAALPVLREVANKHELNCYLGVLHRGLVSYLVAIQSSGPIVIRGKPGTQTHVHSTALGKVLLAAQTTKAAQEFLQSVPLPRLTPKTNVSPEKLLVELAEVRRVGYAISDEENLPGVFSIGAPVRDRTGQVKAAISVACPRYLTVDERIPEIARIVVNAGEAVSERLGFSGTPAGGTLDQVRTRTGERRALGSDGIVIVGTRDPLGIQRGSRMDRTNPKEVR